MATFLEANLFGYFNSLFVFLFILVASYAILTALKVFGENAFVNAIISFILASFFASSSIASKLFAYATPWLVMLLLLCLFLVIIFKFLGAGEKDIPIYPVNNKTISALISFIIILIFIFSAGQAIKENKQQMKEAGITAQPTFVEKISETLRHPAILGIIMVMLIATFAVMLLAATPDH